MPYIASTWFYALVNDIVQKPTGVYFLSELTLFLLTTLPQYEPTTSLHNYTRVGLRLNFAYITSSKVGSQCLRASTSSCVLPERCSETSFTKCLKISDALTSAALVQLRLLITNRRQVYCKTMLYEKIVGSVMVCTVFRKTAKPVWAYQLT